MFTAVGGRLQAQQPPAAPGSEAELSCIAQIELPKDAAIGFLGKRDFFVTVTIGSDGSAAGVEFAEPAGAWKITQNAIIDALHHASYQRNCAGKKIALQFSYRTVGEPEDHPTASVQFAAPNRFIFTAPPQEINPDSSPIMTMPNPKKLSIKK